MIVLSQRDVLNSSVVGFQVALHMFKEPGFKVQADSINLMSKRKKGRLNVTKYVIKHVKTSQNTRSQTPHLIRLSVVSHGSRHDDSGVQSVLDALHKCVLLVLRCLSEAFTDVLQSSDRLIVQLHPGLSWDYFNLSCHQEP